MTSTIRQLLNAIERAKPKPVHVFCHPDDLTRVAEAAELLPAVTVLASDIVPAGAALADSAGERSSSDAPEGPPGATHADDHPPAGVPGPPEAPQAPTAPQTINPGRTPQ